MSTESEDNRICIFDQRNLKCILDKLTDGEGSLNWVLTLDIVKTRASSSNANCTNWQNFKWSGVLSRHGFWQVWSSLIKKSIYPGNCQLWNTRSLTHPYKLQHRQVQFPRNKVQYNTVYFRLKLSWQKLSSFIMH